MAGYKLSAAKTAARTFLAAVDLWEQRYVDPFGAFAAAGIATSPNVPRGCHGITVVGAPPESPAPDGMRTLDVNELRARLEHDKVIVRCREDGHPMAAQQIAGHEGGHVVLFFHYAAQPEHEATADRIGLLLRVPEPSVAEALVVDGLDDTKLRARYPAMYPSEIYLRITMFHEAYAFVGGRALGREVANDNAAPRAIEARAKALRESARQAGRLVSERDGSFAAPFEDPGARRGIVVVVLDDQEYDYAT